MTRIFFVSLLLCLGLSQAAFTQTKDYKAGAIEVHEPWARASVTTNAAAYLQVLNHGSAPDRLINVSTPIAGTAELHEHKMDDGVMKMRPVAGIDIPPGGGAALKPGGYHVMLMHLKHPLKAGAHFPLTLTFAKAGKIEVEVPVEAAGAMHGDDMKAGHEMPGMSDHGMQHK